MNIVFSSYIDLSFCFLFFLFAALRIDQKIWDDTFISYSRVSLLSLRLHFLRWSATFFLLVALPQSFFPMHMICVQVTKSPAKSPDSVSHLLWVHLMTHRSEHSSHDQAYHPDPRPCERTANLQGRSCSGPSPYLLARPDRRSR